MCLDCDCQKDPKVPFYDIKDRDRVEPLIKENREPDLLTTENRHDPTAWVNHQMKEL